MYPCIKSLVDELLNDNPSLRISVTGHSLGGAQATLIASHLLFDGVVSPSKLDLYTFGAPRVGDRDFAYEFDRVRTCIQYIRFIEAKPVELLTLDDDWVRKNLGCKKNP